MYNEWKSLETYRNLLSACDKEGITIVQGAEGEEIKLIISRPPYAKNVIILRARTFREAYLFMLGYKQHKFEMENTV